MASDWWVDHDVCEMCGGTVAVWMKRDFAAGGRPPRPIIQRVECLQGCVGQVLPRKRMMSRGA
jgi:hypothetical protein